MYATLFAGANASERPLIRYPVALLLKMIESKCAPTDKLLVAVNAVAPPGYSAP